jgi:hypothetical protein
MNKNGPIALCFNALVILFTLAPILVVCVIAFTPKHPDHERAGILAALVQGGVRTPTS